MIGARMYSRGGIFILSSSAKLSTDSLSVGSVAVLKALDSSGVAISVRRRLSIVTGLADRRNRSKLSQCARGPAIQLGPLALHSFHRSNPSSLPLVPS